MPSSWNYLHWALSAMAKLHQETQVEECSFPFTDFMSELLATIKDDENRELINERCCVTGMTPLHCFVSSALMQYEWRQRNDDVQLHEWVGPVLGAMKAAGADFTLLDKANRNITDAFLR